jgi:hypothetical protein
MREAFPDWGGERPYVMSIAEPDPKGHDTFTVATSPAQVVGIDATHRVLAVIGTISDDAGHLGGGHSVPGNLGAYWFELRDGRWFVTHRRDSILWAGSSGNLGTVKQAELGPTTHALVIDSGWCGQGYCVGALDVVEIGSDAARPVLTVAPFSSESLGVSEGCKEVLQGAKDLAPVVMQALTPENCFDIGGKWRIDPRADSDRGDFVIDFDGSELAEDAATHAKSIHRVAESMVFRYSGHGYKQSSGRNPNHRV